MATKEELRAIVSDEGRPVAERQEAEQLLVELEQKPDNIFDATIAQVKREYAERTGRPFPKVW